MSNYQAAATTREQLPKSARDIFDMGYKLGWRSAVEHLDEEFETALEYAGEAEAAVLRHWRGVFKRLLPPVKKANHPQQGKLISDAMLSAVGGDIEAGAVGG